MAPDSISNNSNKKSDDSIPCNNDQNLSQSTNTTNQRPALAGATSAYNHAQNLTMSTSSNTHSNNSRSRSNQTTDKQHGNNNHRRSSNYSNSRHHNNRNRQNVDSNMMPNHPISNQNIIQVTSSNNSHGRSSHYHNRNSGNRYDSNSNYGNNPKNYDNKNTNQQHESTSTTAASSQQTYINQLVIDEVEFPSLNDPNVINHKPSSDNNFSNVASSSSLSIHSSSQRGSTSQNTNLNKQSNQPFYMSGVNSSPSVVNSQHHPSHQQQHNVNRPYHGNRRGNYNKNTGSRDHHHQGNYNKSGNYHRSSNASQQNTVTVMPSSNTVTPISSENQTPNNSNSSYSANYVHQNQHSAISINSNSRPRGTNRRSGNNNASHYDYNRRNNTRDFSPMPGVITNVRIGMQPTPPITQVPVSYINGNRGYQPVVTPLPHAISSHPAIAIPADPSGNIATVYPPSKPAPYYPGESPQDIHEAEQYKSLTGVGSNLPREEQAKHQIEFYFSNNNLKNDAYLRTQMDKDGWVDAIVVLRFHRLSKYNLSLSALVPILDSTPKMEYKTENGVLKIRRTDEPEKWTTAGLERQKQELFKYYPELEHVHETTSNTQNHPPPPQHIQHVPQYNYSVPYNRYTPFPPYVGTYPATPIAPHQLGVSYPIYPLDDMGNVAHISYDQNVPLAYAPPTGIANNAAVISGYPDQTINTSSNTVVSSYSQPAESSSHRQEAADSVNSTQLSYNSSTNSRINQQQSRSSDSAHPDVSFTTMMPTAADSENGYQSSAAATSTKKSDSTKGNSKTLTSSQGLSTNTNLSESYNVESTFHLSEDEYKDLLHKLENNLKISPNSNADSVKNSNYALLYRYWTQNLVLNFDMPKYELFKKYAMQDSKRNQKEGIHFLYQFFERFLHRYPITTSNAAESLSVIDDSVAKPSPSSELNSSTDKRLSIQIFNDFQQIAYDDYTQNECVFGFKKLLKFRSQFSNPLRQPPPFLSYIQRLMETLNLDESPTKSQINKDNASKDIISDGSYLATDVNADQLVNNTLASGASSSKSTSTIASPLPKDSLSTHH